MHADKRINQVRAGPNIQNRGLLRNNAATIVSQQIGKIVEIIGTPRHGRAEKAFRDIPVRNAVKMRQQGFIQHFYRLRVGKVDRRLTGWGLHDVVLQRRAALA